MIAKEGRKWVSGGRFLERLRQVRRVAQPPEPPSILNAFYRTISIFPSMLIADTRVTPNQITVAWIALGLLGVVALASVDYMLRISGALLLQLSYLLDFVDGEVARLQHRTSKRGLFLDLIGHGLVKTSLFLGIGYGIWATGSPLHPMLLAVLACVSLANAHVLPFYAERSSLRDRPDEKASSAPPASRIFSWQPVRDAIGALFQSTGLFGTVLVAALLNRLDWILLFYGIMGPAWLLHRARKYKYEKRPGETMEHDHYVH